MSLHDRLATPEGRSRHVRRLFATIADRYDFITVALSYGQDRGWKRRLVALGQPAGGRRALDLATGTGDIAFALASSGARVVGLDITPRMIELARGKAPERSGSCAFVVGDMLALPFPDRSFEAYTIAFGIRNVTHIETALREAHRVLKPGGRFLCLEFSQVNLPGLDKLYDAYSFNVIPRMGKLVTGDAEPYQYLVESIRRFPDQEHFKSMIEAAGFARVNYRNLSGGIAALHSGWRL